MQVRLLARSGHDWGGGCSLCPGGAAWVWRGGRHAPCNCAAATGRGLAPPLAGAAASAAQRCLTPRVCSLPCPLTPPLSIRGDLDLCGGHDPVGVCGVWCVVWEALGQVFCAGVVVAASGALHAPPHSQPTVPASCAGIGANDVANSFGTSVGAGALTSACLQPPPPPCACCCPLAAVTLLPGCRRTSPTCPPRCTARSLQCARRC